MRHAMIDLETLGTESDAVILSIGAVKFDLDSDEMDDDAFYASVSIDSNLAVGRKITEATMLFWLQQPPEAQAVFMEPKQSLESALSSLEGWLGPDWLHPRQKHMVWSKGASFDIPMLQHAYRGFGWSTPWHFWNAMCVRTYAALPGMRDVKVANPQKHNALQDAIAQVKLVQAIQKKLNSAHPMVKT